MSKVKVSRIIGRNAGGEWKVLKSFPQPLGDGQIDYWVDRLGQWHKQVFYQEGPEHKLSFPPEGAKQHG